jgi:hypothetical protein
MKRRGALLVSLALGCGGAFSELEGPSGPMSTAEVARHAMPSVVLIEITRNDGAQGMGTGFVVDRVGRIVTNWHVIEDAASGVVHVNDGQRITDVKVLAVDKEHDLAILYVKARGLTPLPLAPGLPAPGEKIVAIGHPRGLTNTISDGIVSAIRADGVRDREIQMTVPISPGNSGGPVLNEYGQVVGVSVKTRIDGQNLNFAVPVGYIKALLPADHPLPLGRAARSPRGRLMAGCEEGDRELVHRTLWSLFSRLQTARKTIDAEARFRAFQDAAIELSLGLKNCDGVRRLILGALARAEAGEDGPRDRTMVVAFERLIADVRNSAR